MGFGGVKKALVEVDFMWENRRCFAGGFCLRSSLDEVFSFFWGGLMFFQTNNSSLFKKKCLGSLFD